MHIFFTLIFSLIVSFAVDFIKFRQRLLLNLCVIWDQPISIRKIKHPSLFVANFTKDLQTILHACIKEKLYL